MEPRQRPFFWGDFLSIWKRPNGYVLFALNGIFTMLLLIKHCLQLINGVCRHDFNTSTVRSPPSKVLTFSSWSMVANGSQKTFNKKSSKVEVRLQNVRCLKVHYFHSKNAPFAFAWDKFKGSLTLRQPVWMPKIARFLHSDSYYKIHEFSMQICI